MSKRNRIRRPRRICAHDVRLTELYIDFVTGNLKPTPTRDTHVTTTHNTASPVTRGAVTSYPPRSKLA